MVGFDDVKNFANENSDQINEHLDNAQEQHGDKLGEHGDKINQGIDAAQGKFLNGTEQEDQQA